MRGRGKTLGTIDLHVATRLRERRVVLGISQPELAVVLGLTFQQVHKYEQGKNRISAGRLYEFGKALDVPITFFFEGIGDSSTPVAHLAAVGQSSDDFGYREAIEFFAAYRGIPDALVRRRLRDLARALSAEPNGSTAPAPRSQSGKRARRVRPDRGGGAAKR